MKSFLKKLNQIIPLYLTIIVNFPLILGYFLNSDLVATRLIAINFLYQTLFVLFYRAANNVLIYRVGLFIISIISILESLHWIILKGPLSTSSLFVISATNFEESLGFMSIKLDQSLLLIIPLLIISILAFKKKLSEKTNINNPYLYSIFLLVFLAFVIENAVNNRLIRKGVPNFIKVAVTFEQQLDLFKSAKEGKATQKVEAKSEVREQTIVLILGESLNRNHMQLYGAEQATTPLLSQREDLLVFDNVVSSYSNTISSVLTSLSETALNNDISLDQGKDVIDVFHSAGFTNYWISNQTPIGVWENLVTVLARKVDHPIFVNLSSSNSMESTLTNSYDELLFKPIQNILQTDDSLKFIVVHTMGNHSSYKNRYPADFDLFSGKDKQSQIRAEYHNSILYHDHVVDSILNIVDTYCENAIVLYTADHGENVFDEGGNLGHDYAGKLPKSNVEIPFFVWFSDESRTMNKRKIGLSDERKTVPYVTDHLFHTLIDLARIQTPLLIKENSIVNAKFQANRKRILEDGKDYDEEL
ncbi:phosphoethanolamine transferase [Brumimicrobium oceani]|uniref:Sulfatase N-terminal domain-containing protein n=1 Tax=Brumimicrobium oceani TaxID=2100725 RepID=A0A2U2XGW3_9FLAO|nr:phosphoethanolamine transferase [Brumimicrobium oceani]PWH87039.1 hypothetical protein DIT68_01915 [Brumimicrobium oceani]